MNFDRCFYVNVKSINCQMSSSFIADVRAPRTPRERNYGNLSMALVMTLPCNLRLGPIIPSLLCPLTLIFVSLFLRKRNWVESDRRLSSCDLVSVVLYSYKPMWKVTLQIALPYSALWKVIKEGARIFCGKLYVNFIVHSSARKKLLSCNGIVFVAVLWMGFSAENF